MPAWLVTFNCLSRSDNIHTEDKHTVYEVLKPVSFLSNCSNHCIEERNQQKQNHHKLYTECLQKKKSLLLLGLKRMIQIVHALWKYVWTTRKLPWKCPDLFPSELQVWWVKKLLNLLNLFPSDTGYPQPWHLLILFFCCSSVLSCQLRTLICWTFFAYSIDLIVMNQAYSFSNNWQLGSWFKDNEEYP